MIVASMIDLPRMIRPCSSNTSFWASNSFSQVVVLQQVAKVQQRRRVGTCSTAKSSPMNRRIAYKS